MWTKYLPTRKKALQGQGMANRDAFLSMVAVAEGTKGKGDDGYNVIVGGKLFSGYSDHPRIKVWIRSIQAYSTAAGRYQIRRSIFDHYKAVLNLADFSPSAQDAIAIKLIRECRALEDVDAGRFDAAVAKCRSRWASFPGAGYGQPEKKIEALRAAYESAGGSYGKV